MRSFAVKVTMRNKITLGLARFQPTLTLGPHGLPFLPSPALPSPPNQQQPQPPCSTLFVANLGQFVSDHELKDIFARSVAKEIQQQQQKKKRQNRKKIYFYVFFFSIYIYLCIIRHTVSAFVLIFIRVRVRVIDVNAKHENR